MLFNTPALIWNIGALAVATKIEVFRTNTRNNRAGISSGAPSEASLESQTFSAVITCVAAFWNLDASISCGAPSEVGCCADAIATIIVIIWTVHRDCVAGQSFGAPGEACLDGQTTSTSVVCVATLRNRNAPLCVGAPSRVGVGALTLSTFISCLWAFDGNGKTVVHCVAPSVSGNQRQAGSAIVVSFTADGNLDAFSSF